MGYNIEPIGIWEGRVVPQLRWAMRKHGMRNVSKARVRTLQREKREMIGPQERRKMKSYGL